MTRPVGLFHMRDEKGEDEKVPALPVADPHYEKVRELGHFSRYFLREVERLLGSTKILKGKRLKPSDGRTGKQQRDRSGCRSGQIEAFGCNTQSILH